MPHADPKPRSHFRRFFYQSQIFPRGWGASRLIKGKCKREQDAWDQISSEFHPVLPLHTHQHRKYNSKVEFIRQLLTLIELFPANLKISHYRLQGTPGG